jgi:hypothetical protein
MDAEPLSMPSVPPFQTNMTVFHHRIGLFATRRESHE